MDDEEELEKQSYVEEWHKTLKEGLDIDSWGQPVEAIDHYASLASCMGHMVQPHCMLFNDEQKKTVRKIIICLDMRSQSLQFAADKQAFALTEVQKLEKELKSLLLQDAREFPVDISNYSSELSSLRYLEEEEVSINVQANTEQDPQRPSCHVDSVDEDSDEEDTDTGSLLSPIPPVEGFTSITLRLEKIGLKDPAQYINPFITVTVKDHYGVDLTASQDTPVATRKDHTFVYLSVAVHIQKPLELLGPGFGIFLEFKHYKPKKGKVSTRCWAFMEADEIKDGPAALELYKKPTDFKRKKIRLLTVKPLYLQLKVVCNGRKAP